MSSRIPLAPSVVRIAALALALGAAAPARPQPAETFDTLMAAARFTEAEQLARRQLADLDAGGHGHTPAAADAIERLVTTLARQQRKDAAVLDLMRRAIRLRESTAQTAGDPDSLSLARTLESSAFLVPTPRGSAEGERIDFLERALEIRVRAGDVAGAGRSAYILGSLLTEAHDYRRARALLERSIAYREQAFGPTHPSIGQPLLSLGILHDLMGDTFAASEVLQRALTLVDGTSQWPDVATRQVGLLIGAGEFDRARTLLDRVLASVDQSPEPEWTAADAHRRYSELLRQTGDADAARRHAEIAAQVHERLGMPLGLGWSLRQLAGIASETGDDERALPLYERAMTLHEGVMRDHPEAVESRAQYAAALARLGRIALARPQVLLAADGSLRLVRLALGGLPERQAVLYASRHRRNLELALTLAERTPSADEGFAGDVFDRVIRSRALVLDEVARRHGTPASPEGAAIRQTLIAAREREARLAVRSSERADVQNVERLATEARRATERAEEALAAIDVPFRLGRDEHRAGVEDIQRALDATTVLVGYVHYADASSQLAGKPASSRYGAFVVSRGRSQPAFVPLGPAAAIEAAVMATRAELLREATSGGRGGRRTLARYRAAATTLRTLVWDPIAVHLGSAMSVLIVPDGALHLVSFAALPAGTDRYLVDSGPTLHYLAAERDLLRRTAQKGQGLLAVGSPRFDAAITLDTAAGSPRSATAMGDECGDLQAMRFGPLPASASEARSIVALWTKAGLPGAGLLADAAASETAFKQRAPGQRVIHMATHGFFAGSRDCKTTPASATGAAPAFGTALLRSGLALAGANHRNAAASADDGMLVAAEIANLDLSGVEWAVLSACDTGLGSIATGEGVFGLRRAFRVAGAATVIMTLWPVDDRATAGWMERLYAARLIGKLSTAESVRAATRGVLGARRRAGQTVHPFYWGGFVAAGDWR